MSKIDKEFRKPVFRPFKPAGIGNEKILLNYHHTPKGKNCQISSLQKILEFNNFIISEEMLFGVGSGIGFLYWHVKDISIPFSGGMNSGKFPGLTGRIVNCLNGNYQILKTSSVKLAHKHLKETLHMNQPAMVCVDMAYIDYFGVHENEHFGQHIFLVYGIDEPENIAYISDRFDVVVTLPLTRLQQARSSFHPPFPAMNRLLRFNFPEKLPDLKLLINQGIQENTNFMFNHPLENFGLSGILKWSKELEKYPKLITEKNKLLRTLLNHYIYIETGGTGGSLFRKMYSEFLKQAFEITQKYNHFEASQDFLQIATKWTEIAHSFLSDDFPMLKEIREILLKNAQELEKLGNKALKGILRRRDKMDQLLKIAQEEIYEIFPTIAKQIVPLLQEVYNLEFNAFEKLK
ncbi:MAG: DUF4872 domain-containing protein [Candidatus Heimdallarchaeota archaeon]|nr:DUF4872 domain-containing protein [Candidatus Heimdallarchaeota archaeon]